MKYLLVLLFLTSCASPRGIYYNCAAVEGNDIRQMDGEDTRHDCEKRGLFARLFNLF